MKLVPCDPSVYQPELLEIRLIILRCKISVSQGIAGVSLTGLKDISRAALLIKTSAPSGTTNCIMCHLNSAGVGGGWGRTKMRLFYQYIGCTLIEICT